MKKTSKPSPAASKQPNKSEFVRSQPGVPAKEIVAKAKSQGMKLTEAYVYTVRSSAKAAQKPVAAAPVQAPPGDAHMAFRRMVLNLGLSSAQAILDEMRVKLDALVQGR